MKTKATIIALLLTITICSVWAGWFLTIENPDNVMGVNASFIMGVNISTGGSTPVAGNKTISEDFSTDLSAYYRFDTDGAIIDQVIGNNGTINGATYTASGKINGGYIFDGTNDKITIPDDNWFNGDFTFAMWVYPDTKTNDDRIMTQGITGNLAYLRYQTSFNGIRFALVGSDGAALLDAPNTYVLNAWQYLLVTRSGNDYELFINNVSVATHTVDIGTYNPTVDVTLGQRGDTTRLFNGTMDEVGVWSRALNESQIQDIYNNGSGIPYN